MRARALRLLAPFCVLASCAPEEARVLYPRTGAGGPAPTEDWLDEEAEEEQSSRRKAWFEERHKAPPEVDWRAIERANGLAQIEKRNALARSERASVASPWVERGSQNQAGRVHAVARASDGESLYLGTSLGGVWKGKLDGSEWKPIGDNLYGGAHWVLAIPSHVRGQPDVVLAATDGGLVHVTRDEGATWTVPAGVPPSVLVRRALVTSDGSDTVFLVLPPMGPPYTHRLLRSTDRMASFQQVFDFGNFGGDVWARRDGGADLYLLDDSGVHVSADLGTTWSPVGTPPVGLQYSCELTGSEAGAPRLWAMYWSQAGFQIQRSDDAGVTWSFAAIADDYWIGSMNASIVDVDTFAYGGVLLRRTYNGGATFAAVNLWQSYYSNPRFRLHADIPGIDVFPGGPEGETWYVSTDGGLYESLDALHSVENLSLSGLRVSQYYSTHTSRANPDHVVAGAQDQGYQRAGSPPPATGTQLDFVQHISGDYGHLTSGDGDHEFLFSTYPGFIVAQVGEDVPILRQLDFPAGETSAWMPPVVADPLDPRQFFFCASHLYRYTRNQQGGNWSQSLWSTFDFGGTWGYDYISALVFSPLDPQRAYAATDDGRVFRSLDHGVTWTQSASLVPTGQYFYGTALLASSSDVDTVWVGGSGYGGPPVLRSVDGGLTFQPFSTGLPPTLVYCLGEAPDGSGTLFCGTETAAYRRDASASSWIDVTGAEAPITNYWSVEALPHENVMRFGTYGRGIWDYQIEIQARALVRNGSGVNPPCLSSVTPPVLGGSWISIVDSTGHPGASVSWLLAYDAPHPGRIVRFGEVLIDVFAGAKLFTATTPASGGIDRFLFPVPNDPALVGREAFAQGLISGGGLRLCNALDVVVGY